MRLVSTDIDLEDLEAEIQNLFKERKCTKVLHDRAYRVCVDKHCADCLLVKLDVSLNEVRLTKLVTDAVRSAKGIDRIFQIFVSQYIDDMLYLPAFKTNPESRLLVTSYVSGPTLHQSAKKMSNQDLLATLSIVFATLNFLHETKNFLHMDLKADNIVLREWPEDFDVLTLSADPYVLSFEKMKYLPVLIDYGNATDGKIFGSNVYNGGQWNGKCYFPGFDIIRILKSLYTTKRTTYDILEDMGFDVSVDKKYSMVRARDCTRYASVFPTYKSIFDYDPFQQFVAKKLR
jgi:serine/threonine protein kinase